MRRAIRISILILIAFSAASIFLTENALHVWNATAPVEAEAGGIARQGAATWKPASIQASHGAVLQSWIFTPQQRNGAGVILMHGVGDNRLGMSGHAPFLLRAGYTVLMPDSRGHGSSSGRIITYGVRESDDVHRWAALLLHEPGVVRLYGLGQSMGAAILLESLPSEPRFRAVVADCPFASFEEIAFDRLDQNGLRSRALSWPLLELGFTYARIRYGVNLWNASPAAALARTRTPVLLIHGAADDNIPPRHSRTLHASDRARTELWEVPGAGHVASLSTQPAAYRSRVISWFDAHR
jgi:dipeptidyl aminopeptidase/acylaminoacyl peptidase